MTNRLRDPETGQFISAQENGARNSSPKVDRLRFARRAGLQYDNERDIWEVAGYLKEEELGPKQYWSRYDRQHIAGRLVDMAPQATWRNPPEIHEEGDTESQFTSAVEQLTSRDDLRFWHRLERADRLSRIGRFGGLLIGQATGTDVGLDQELEPMSGPEDVIYLSSFDERHMEVTQWQDDPSSPRFGKPVEYQIDLSSGVTGFPEADARVHWTRVIHVAEDLLADEVFGRPALKRVFNLLFDLEKVTAATAESYWQLADKILVGNVDASGDYQVDDTTFKEMGEALEEIMHDLRRQFLGEGVNLDWLGGDTPDPTSPADLYMTLIASAAMPGIPKRMLFGSETGERASTEDKKTWHETISSRQEHHAEPTILRATLDRLVEFKALPEPNSNYIVEWPSLFELPEDQEAEIDNTRAQAASRLTPVGGDPMERVEVTEEGRVKLLPTEDDG